MNRTTRTARTVFDLTPDELRVLCSLDSTVTAMSPAPSGYASDSCNREIPEGHYAGLQQAKAKRSDWLRARRISATVARQAAETHYDPYRHAGFIDLVAPPMPEGYEQEVLTLEQKNDRYAAQRTALLNKLNAGPDDGKKDIFV